MQRRVDVVPWQGLVNGALAMGVEGGVEPDVVEGLHPGLVIEMLAPTVELRPPPPGVIDDLTHATVTAGQPGLEHRLQWIVPIELEPRTAQLSLQQPLLRLNLIQRIAGHPLKRGVGLGHERAHPGVDPRPMAHDSAANFQDLLA